MNIYFIDTLELTYSSDFDDIIKLTKNFKMVDPKKGAGNKEFISTELSGMGIIIKTRRSSKAELYKSSNKYKLVLRINPNKFYKPYMKTEHISNIIEFCDMVERLDMQIQYCFSGLTIDDFEITRVDLTEDIHGIPEDKITQYIRIMRQLYLTLGFHHNKKLEENTEDFDPDSSFNAVNDSKKVEFVVYNKGHEVRSKKNSSDEQKEHYKDTMRVEVRCRKKFADKLSEKAYTAQKLVEIYRRRMEVIRDVFDDVFVLNKDSCFISPYWQKKQIKKYVSGKTKLGKKMNDFSKQLAHASRPTMESVIENSEKCQRSVSKLLSKFEDMGISSVTTSDKETPLLQSLNTLFGFSLPSEEEKALYEYIRRKSRGKEVFWYGGDGLIFRN